MFKLHKVIEKIFITGKILIQLITEQNTENVSNYENGV